MSIKDILLDNGNLAISLYTHIKENGRQIVRETPLSELIENWQNQSLLLKKDLGKIIEGLSVEMNENR